MLHYICLVFVPLKLVDLYIKTTESRQLRSCKYTLGCSVTTCDEPVRIDLVLNIMTYRRDIRTLKWYCKVMSLKDEILQLKSLTNEWDKIKCKGRHRRSWFYPGGVFKEIIGSPRPSFGDKNNRKIP